MLEEFMNSANINPDSRKRRLIVECGKMRRSVAMILVLCLFFIPLCNSAHASSGEIVVSAAISLKNVFVEIGRTYERKNEGSEVVFNFGASGNLAGQIEGGAPADVFASASEKYMDDLAGRGLLLKGTRSDFAANGIVLIVPKASEAMSGTFEGLKAEKIGQIAVGNPLSVPAGRYALEVLTYYKLLSSMKERLIYGENVRQVLDYVARGEVDAGIVYSTDASIRAKEVKVAAYADKRSHEPVVYPIAVIKGTRKEAAARDFVSFVLSPEGKRILEKYGFREKR